MRLRAGLSQAWALIGADLPLFVLAASLITALSLISAFILFFPLLVGLCGMFLERRRGRRPELSQLWEGLFHYFPAAFTLWLLFLLAALPLHLLDLWLHSLQSPGPAVGVLIVLLGLSFLAVPALFALPLIAEQDLSAWEALQLSVRLVKPHWLRLWGLLLFMGALIALGVFACGVGLFITLPLVVALLIVAYIQIGERGSP